MACCQVECWPALRSLVLVLKSLLKANGLNDVSTGGLGSFALANMALAHLQEEAKVPLHPVIGHMYYEQPQLLHCADPAPRCGVREPEGRVAPGFKS